MRRAPSRARSSSVTAISLSSPTGSLRTSSMACLPAGHHRPRSSATGKVRRLPLQAHPQHSGIAHRELAELRRRAERAEAELAKAKKVIEIQGSVSALLEQMLATEGEHGSIER